MKIALAQIDTHVGAIDANTAKVLRYAHRARDEHGADLVLFPELALSGYPPEDLLLHGGMRRRVEEALTRVRDEVSGIAICVGYPEYQGGQSDAAPAVIYNSAAVFRDGRQLANHRKRVLPNYAVFDEKRYFQPGEGVTVFELNGHRLGLIVCEDVWSDEPARDCAAAGAEAILVINGSPFHIGHQQARERVLAERARETGLPLVYLNMTGGQDELVFDGGSMVLTAHGNVTFRAPPFREGLHVVSLQPQARKLVPVSASASPAAPIVDSVYDALVMGTGDYVNKNGFDGVVLGLSGGVDSALTLCIAVDALGAERVHALMMPSRFTSAMSLEDAMQQAHSMGVRYDVLSIEPMFESTLATLSEIFAGRERDVTEENIQARCRGVLLMAISNKFGRMLLTTGNKSEMAVGYATLYGDMAGGFAPLKDCTKTLVYQLCEHRNRIGAVIPERVITRPPSAELGPDQKDTDSLPPYEVLDPILEAFIEKDYSVDQIAALGFDRDIVGRVLGLVKRAEYKRRQAPPGVRISSRAFGRDWRYPITSGY